MTAAPSFQVGVGFAAPALILEVDQVGGEVGGGDVRLQARLACVRPAGQEDDQDQGLPGDGGRLATAVFDEDGRGAAALGPVESNLLRTPGATEAKDVAPIVGAGPVAVGAAHGVRYVGP
jgi:hypothetical protein